MAAKPNFTVETLGEAKIPSPITYSTVLGDAIANYVRDDEYVLYDIEADAERESKAYTAAQLLQKAGPRQQIYFSPGHVHAAIVTCGGLCPGLNDVIRAITRCLWYRVIVKPIGRRDAKKLETRPETGIRDSYAGESPPELRWRRPYLGYKPISTEIPADPDRLRVATQQDVPVAPDVRSRRSVQFSNEESKPGGARPIFTR
jgi:hypothetical protein